MTTLPFGDALILKFLSIILNLLVGILKTNVVHSKSWHNHNYNAKIVPPYKKQTHEPSKLSFFFKGSIQNGLSSERPT